MMLAPLRSLPTSEKTLTNLKMLMNANSNLPPLLPFALSVGVLFGATTSRGQTLLHVDIATSALVGHASAPFSLDLQLIGDSSGGTPNTITIDHFTFGGGSASGAATLAGGAAGDLSLGVSLDNASAFSSEFYQGFVAGSSLGFDLNFSNNPRSGTPDGFSISILDSSLQNIPTTGTGDSLLLLSIRNPYSSADLELSAGTGTFASVTVSAVPEPGETGIACASLLAVGVLLRRFQRSR